MNTGPSVHCLECGKVLKGRIGKKFCDTACKSAFHNRNKHAGEVTIADVNRILRKNRSILRTLSPEGKATVRKEVLDSMGYDYRYFNGIFRSKLLYYIVYDYAFSPLFDENGTEKALIVQRQGYMDKLTLEIWRRTKKH